jgi:MEMO1 family protein
MKTDFKNPYSIAIFILVFFILFITLLSLISQKASDDITLSNNIESSNITSNSQTIQARKAAVAGTFYPADEKTLNKKLDNLLQKATKISSSNPYRILIAPHAGIDYSGNAAAYAYKQIEGEDFDRIIIIGSSHNHAFTHAAVFAEGVWETPLGQVESDSMFAQKIVSPAQNILNDPSVHIKEHSLELEVIFLRKVLSDFRIVPILVSNPTEELISALAFRIAQNMDEKTLLVISTDLSHYPDYETANTIDKETIDSILTGIKTFFENTFNSHKTKYQRVDTTACGYDSIRVALKVAELLKLDKPELLYYENSGDVTDNKDRVVGYAAIGIPGKSLKVMVPDLDTEAKKEALEIAEKTLHDFVLFKKLPEKNIVKNKILYEPLGVFVTIKKDGELRGCIGEFEPAKPLYKVIQDKTIDAASKDPRFQPVTPQEFSSLSLEISIMNPRNKIEDWRDIRLGKDGVVIAQENKTGTFLPQVATETGWNLEEFLKELCLQKANLPSDCYLDPDTDIYTFQVQIVD